MQIRLSTDKDSVEIASLRHETILNVVNDEYSKEIINDWAAGSNADVLKENIHGYKRFVAIENDKIVGFCDHDLKCELSRLYVHKNHLRKGVGSKLLKTAEGSLKKQGCKVATVEATTNAKQFYEQNDYIVTKKTLHTTDKTKSPVYEMYKKLHLI